MIFWLQLGHVGLTSPVLWTFTAFGPLYLQESFPDTMSTQEAGDAISFLYLSILASPVMGILIDRIGKRALVQFVASSFIPLILVALVLGELLFFFYTCLLFIDL